MTYINTNFDVYVNLEPLKNNQIIISSSAYLGTEYNQFYSHETLFYDILEDIY